MQEPLYVLGICWALLNHSTQISTLLQRFQPSRFDRVSPFFMCCLPLSRFLSDSPDLSWNSENKEKNCLSECKTLCITLAYPIMSRRDSRTESGSDSGGRNDVKMQEMPLERKLNLQNFDHPRGSHLWRWKILPIFLQKGLESVITMLPLALMSRNAPNPEFGYFM